MDQQQLMETLAKILEAQNELEKKHELMSKKLDEMNTKQEALSKQVGGLELVLEQDIFKKISTIQDSREVQKDTIEKIDPLIAAGKKYRHFN